MDITKLLTPCCFSVNHDEFLNEPTNPAAEKLVAYTDFPSAAELQIAAKKTCDKLLLLIFEANTLNTSTINVQMDEIIISSRPITIASSWWTQMVLRQLYKSMTGLVVDIDKLHIELGPVMRKVFDEAKCFAHELEEFQGEHPILAVLVETTALALLIAMLAPFLLEALGFGVEGVVEGKCSDVRAVDDFTD
jgi:hypothetical protein